MKEFRGIKVASQDGARFKKGELVGEFGPKMFQLIWNDGQSKSQGGEFGYEYRNKVSVGTAFPAKAWQVYDPKNEMTEAEKAAKTARIQIQFEECQEQQLIANGYMDLAQAGLEDGVYELTDFQPSHKELQNPKTLQETLSLAVTEGRKLLGSLLPKSTQPLSAEFVKNILEDMLSKPAPTTYQPINFEFKQNTTSLSDDGIAPLPARPDYLTPEQILERNNLSGAWKPFGF